MPRLLLLLLLLGSPAWSQTSPYLYHRDVGESIVIGWDHSKQCPTGQTFSTFQFRGIKEGPTEIKLQGQTSELQVPIQAAFEGILFYEVRAVCMAGSTPSYSSYASSKDPLVSIVAGSPRGWMVQYSIRPPTEVQIGGLP